MASVARIAPELRSLDAPDELKLLPAWLCWRYEQHPGEVKPRKVPVYAGGARRHGAQGTAADRRKLVTFAAARDAAIRQGMDGVGFAPMAEWGVSVIDFDRCVGPDGDLPPEVAAIAERTFSEYSPSGTGIHVVLRGDLGNSKSLAAHHPYGVEAFSSKGFITFSGNPLPHVDILGYENRIAPVDEGTQALCQARFGSSTAATSEDFMAGYEPRLDVTDEQTLGALAAIDADIGRDDWIRVGMALHHQYGEDGFDFWNDWSENGSKYPGEEALRDQWDSFERRTGPGRVQVTMASVFKLAADQREADRKPVKAEDLEQAAASPEPCEGKFKPTRASQMSSAPPKWLIKGVLPQSPDPVILYGSSGSGKSFLAIQLAGCIARGVAWRGHKALQGKVLYVAAEGAGGVRKRLDAYCQGEGIAIDDLDVDVLTVSPNLMDPEDIKEIVRMHAAFGPYVASVLDTFAQVTPGANENAGEDMGLALANTKAIQRATGTTALLVHHAGKDLSRGSRGWSGIKAAAEAQIEVTRDEVTGERAIRVEKMKDGEDGRRYGFALETVTLGTDEDGDNITSCVLVETEVSERVLPGRTQRSVRVRDPYATHLVETIDRVDQDRCTVPVAEFMAMAVETLPAPEGGRDLRRQNLMRGLRSLLAEKQGPLSRDGNILILHV